MQVYGREAGGGKIIPRRRKIYLAAEYLSRRAQVPKSLKKNPKIVAQCQKYPIPYLYTLSRTIPYLYTLNRTIPYLYTLNRTIPCLNTLSRTIPYLNTLSRIIPYVNTLSRTIPYLNTLSRTIPYLNTLNRIIPYLNTLRKKNKFSPKPSSCRQPIRIEHEKPRQPIRIVYHSAETYFILIHGLGTLLGPGHESAAIAYLNTWRVPDPPDQLTLLLLRSLIILDLDPYLNTLPNNALS